ncbi:MAG: hypothetical protein HY787_12150 [Deltaproteobacteria bacterium]|nr:hypothetical protein [Deltaproteobacteria bacterium]
MKRQALLLKHIIYIPLIGFPIECDVPRIAQIHQRTGTLGGDQNLEGIFQDTGLQFPVIRFTAGMPQGKVDKRASRGTHPGHHVPAGSQIERWESGLLDASCDQTDRLVV